MQLHQLKPNKGSKHSKRRIARGIGSGLGKTAGRGMKGQKARRQISPWFEGGQTPLHRRLPLKKGFKNINHKEYAIVNLDDLENLFEANSEVNIELLLEKSLIPKNNDGLKILGFGSLTKKLTVKANAFSKSAEAAITKAGGEVIKL